MEAVKQFNIQVCIIVPNTVCCNFKAAIEYVPGLRPLCYAQWVHEHILASYQNTAGHY